jgi:transcriptional regulator with XRE-family HTH domain
MAIRFEEIGRRLRAYRFGKNLTASEVADRIGVSRAAVYRLEKGELVKIETIEKLAALLEVSLPSLMGVGVEYYNNSIAFFERVRQLEEDTNHVLGNFSPLSFLLMSEEYMNYLRLMLIEALSQVHPQPDSANDLVERLLQILQERRKAAASRRTPIVSIVNMHEVERFVRFGLVGRLDLPAEVVRERRAAARAEIARFIRILKAPPLGTQIGIVEDIPSAQTFQIFDKATGAAVTLSPYRLGDNPNITSGIAMVTAAPEAVQLFKETIILQWDKAHKGESGARVLQAVLDRVDEDGVFVRRSVALASRRAGTNDRTGA